MGFDNISRCVLVPHIESTILSVLRVANFQACLATSSGRTNDFAPRTVRSSASPREHSSGPVALVAVVCISMPGVGHVHLVVDNASIAFHQCSNHVHDPAGEFCSCNPRRCLNLLSHRTLTRVHGSGTFRTMGTRMVSPRVHMPMVSMVALCSFQPLQVRFESVGLV